MTTHIPHGPLTDYTASLLDLITEDARVTDDYDKFVAAARTIANHCLGVVSMNDMREELSNSHGLTIEPRRYSGFYRKACKDGFLSWPGGYDVNADTRSGNAGRPQRLYAWVGRS